MAHLFILLQFMFQLGVYWDPRVSFDPYETGVTNIRKYACPGKFEYDFSICNLLIPLLIDDALKVCEMHGGHVPVLAPKEVKEMFETLTDSVMIYRAQNTTLSRECVPHCETMVSDYEDFFITKDDGRQHSCDCPLDFVNDEITVLCRKEPGLPCEYRGRDTDLNLAPAKIKLNAFNDTNYIALMPSVDWRFGDFACTWRIKQSLAKGQKSNGLLLRISIVVDVKTLTAIPRRHCFGRLTILDTRNGNVLFNNSCIRDKLQVVHKTSLVGIYYKTDDIQNRVQTYTVLTENPDVLVQFAVRNTEVGTIGLHINTTERILEQNIPKSYVATEEGLPQDFTWDMAQKFCESKTPNGSLCRLKDACRYGSWIHLNGSVDHQVRPTRFLPLRNGINRWAEYSAYSACNYAPRIMDPRVPPMWGFEQGHCPRGNCDIKKYIYCCDYEEKTKIHKPKAVVIFQESLDIYNEVYAYKFIPDRFTRYTPIEVKKRPYYNNWKDFARLPGDARMFTLKDGYSDEFPTPVYICKRMYFTHRAQLSDEIYIIALKCQQPYFDLYQFYTSLEPRNNTVPLYVGASTQADILTTRVSLGGFCCGYDEPDHSFIMYGVGSMSNVMAPREGAGYVPMSAEPRGSTSFPINSISTATTDSFIFIIAQEGRGIKLTPTGVIDVGISRGGDKECFLSPAAVEVSNPITHRVYAIYCGRHEGPHETIYSDSKVLQIRLMSAEKYNITEAQFSVDYEEIPFTIPRPVRVANQNNTWLGAQQACKNRELDLCRKSELCAGNIHKSFMGSERRRGAIAPVLDHHLAVVEIEFTSCVYKDGDDVTSRLTYETMCCNYTINTDIPNWPVKPFDVEPLVLHQVKFKNHKSMGFGFVTDMTELSTFVNWRNLTRTKLTNNTGMVSSFTLSKHYTDIFNQVVYVCHDDKLKMRIQLERCSTTRRSKLYRGYAANQNTPDSSLTKIYIARSPARSSRVTLKESTSNFSKDQFTLYVINAKEFK